MSRVEQRLRIEPDGTVTAFSGKVELGQNLRVSFPRIVAEELQLAPERVAIVLGETDVCPPDIGTFGSMSVEFDGEDLRRAAAECRRQLIERAAQRLRCSPTALMAAGGEVRTGDGRGFTFAELVADSPVTGEVPEAIDRIARAPLPPGPVTAEAIALVTGATEFVADVRLPGMLHGAILHPPQQGARLRHANLEAARRVPGVVKVIEEADFVGVVARGGRPARAALTALQAQWDPPGPLTAPVQTSSLRDDGGLDEALAGAAQRLEREYDWPNICAATIGPSVGIADVRASETHLFGSTQRPFPLREQVALLTGQPPERVHFHPRATSGGYGRHGAGDAALEAARLSKAVGAPVKVQWNRQDELRTAPSRGQMRSKLEAGLDASGQIIAWRSRVWTNTYAYDAGTEQRRAPSATPQRPGPGGRAWDPAQMAVMMAGRNGLPAYLLGKVAVELNIEPSAIRTGALRSLGAAPNIFAIESFIDELAHAAGADPLAFRLRHVVEPRLAEVLRAVGAASGWCRPRIAGHGLGLACAIYRNTCVAQVAEVALEDGGPRLERVWCAVDAGHLVDPAGALNQVEGAIQMGASWALLEELRRDGASITAHGWRDYPIATFLDAPKSIDVVFTGSDAHPSEGLGEPGVVPISAAIANAVFDAGAPRPRRLPIARPPSPSGRGWPEAG